MLAEPDIRLLAALVTDAVADVVVVVAVADEFVEVEFVVVVELQTTESGTVTPAVLHMLSA